MLLAWSWIQHLIAGAIMFHLFMVMDIENPSLLDYLYGLFLFGLKQIVLKEAGDKYCVVVIPGEQVDVQDYGFILMEQVYTVE